MTALRLHQPDNDDESARADRLNPLADVPMTSATMHDTLKSRLTSRIEVPTIRIEVALRPGVEISYRCNLSPQELQAAEKKGRRVRDGDPNLAMMLICMSAAAEDLYIDGEKQCRVPSEEFLAIFDDPTVASIADGIGRLYADQDGFVLSAFVQLMLASGYPDPTG